MPEIPLGSAPLPYRWSGDEGPPVVLIPGLGGKGTSWEPFLSSVSEKFRTLTLDPPGSGAARPLSGPITIRDLARPILDLFDHLGIEQAPVIGRSMGGMVAQELALLAPHRVSRLVLVSTTGRTDRHLGEVFRLWARMAELGLPADVRHRSAMLWCLGARALAEDDRAKAYLRSKALTDRPKDYAIQARACAEHDALARLPQLRIPCLVVAGTDDRLTPPSHAETLARAIPGAALRTIAEAGHLPYLEAPGAFEGSVLEFLEAESRQPTGGREEDPLCQTALTA